MNKEQRDAVRETTLRWRRENPDGWHEILRRAQDNKSKYIKDIRSSFPCKICGEKDPIVLEFHHVDPSKKSFGFDVAAHRRIGNKKIDAEIAKCVVLCANCHAKLHHGIVSLAVAQIFP
jgi:hypothetical protein